MAPARLTRAEQQAATRERLLAAAERVFALHGFGAASIDLIALEAGFSKGAFYSNFESKEQLFLDLLRIYMDRDLAALENLMSLEPAKLERMVTEWLMTMHADKDCPVIVAELQLQARRNSEFAKQYYLMQDQQINMLADILERYFKALSKKLPIKSVDLAASRIALAQGISLQNSPGKRGTPSEPSRIIDGFIKLISLQ